MVARAWVGPGEGEGQRLASKCQIALRRCPRNRTTHYDDRDCKSGTVKHTDLKQAVVGRFERFESCIITAHPDLGHVGGRVGVPGQIGIYPLPTYPSGVLDTTPYPLPTYPQFAAVTAATWHRSYKSSKVRR